MANAIATYRRDHPLCEWPECPRLADHVDHIVPLAELPKGDWRRYDHANMQSLCEGHHQIKTTADALRGKRRRR
ncbi:HNH endonuclease [Mycolicibacterium goodii]|uniref:HNH endonuclease n=1 Tax=Mycolicibacterium goodii TaxID=134601 RepID=UPI001BDC47B3|nr:HNH endonuclease [Mycolicibacterium goodii]MBU8819561.1 HNH endonuclease [Mycolicibacterium goodii]